MTKIKWDEPPTIKQWLIAAIVYDIMHSEIIAAYITAIMSN